MLGRGLESPQEERQCRPRRSGARPSAAESGSRLGKHVPPAEGVAASAHQGLGGNRSLGPWGRAGSIRSCTDDSSLEIARSRTGLEYCHLHCHLQRRLCNTSISAYSCGLGASHDPLTEAERPGPGSQTVGSVLGPGREWSRPTAASLGELGGA